MSESHFQSDVSGRGGWLRIFCPEAACHCFQCSQLLRLVHHDRFFALRNIKADNLNLVSTIRAGEFDNAGAMMSVDETLMCSFQGMDPDSLSLLVYLYLEPSERADWCNSIATGGKEKGFCWTRQYSGFTRKALNAHSVEVSPYPFFVLFRLSDSVKRLK